MKPKQFWPTTTAHDPDYRKLSDRQQGLFQKLYLSTDIDSAGFQPLQLDWWSTGCTPTVPIDELRALIDSLAPAWVVADYDAHQTLVVPRMRLDEVHKQPNVYIAACRSILAARSDLLAEHAYTELKRLPSPTTTKPDTQARIDRAYDELMVAMETRSRRSLDAAIAETLSEPFPKGIGTLPTQGVGGRVEGNPSGTLPEPTGEGEGAGEGEGPRSRPATNRHQSDPSRCSACGTRPPGGGPYFSDLCDKCLPHRQSRRSASA